MARIRRIMHASDFSGSSRAAFRHAVEMARRVRAELIVAHVLAPPIPPLMGEGTYLSPATWDRVEAEARAAAQKQIDRLVRTARDAGVRATGLVIEGTAADRIVRVARAKAVDLLVLGTHGRTGLPKVILGSVAARVVATAPCPVLTVRTR
jgi:nucleotide-binding universal stress UspA family protein